MLCPWCRPWEVGKMDSIQVLLLVLGLILVVSVQTGSGWKCYDCNTAYPSDKDDCNDPQNDHFVVDCNDKYKARGLNYTYCRKIIQTVGDDYRVIRQCAAKARVDRGCVERTGTKGIKLTLCECGEERCNTAPPTCTINLLLLSLVSGLLALVYHS